MFSVDQCTLKEVSGYDVPWHNVSLIRVVIETKERAKRRFGEKERGRKECS
jgi:hypothetical protein